MNSNLPQIPEQLTPIQHLSSYAQDFLSEEAPIFAIQAAEERLMGEDFSKLDIRSSVFKSCSFSHCRFENAGFIDVVFDSCDFSNSSFTGAFFERCRFVSCKCLGLDLTSAVMRQVSFEESGLQYANLNSAKLTDLDFDRVDFTEASLSEAKLKRFSAVGSKFIRCNFYKTSLAAVDFTENELLAPIVSSPPVELKGAVITMFQSADLIRLWGIVVKP